MAFWGSLLGNVLGGTALGGLAAKATGGDWRRGALIGTAGGALNYGLGSGGTNWAGGGKQTFAQTGLGGLFGGGGAAVPENTYSVVDGTSGTAINAAGNTAKEVAQNNAGTSSGLLGTMTGYGKALKPWAEIGAGGFSAYGNIQGARTQQQMAEDEAAYRNRIADLQEREYNLASKYLQEDRARQADRLANEEAIQAFSGSALRRNTLEDEQFLQPVETVNNNAADAFAQTSKTTNYYD